MTGPETPENEIDLDALFDKARGTALAPSDALMDRIAADAAAHQPRLNEVRRKSPGPLSQLVETLGGWPTLGGLVTAAAAGVYIGIAQPELVIDGGGVSDEGVFISADLWPDDTMFFEEG